MFRNFAAIFLQVIIFFIYIFIVLRQFYFFLSGLKIIGYEPPSNNLDSHSTNMPLVGFEPMIPMFGQAKTFRALYFWATSMGSGTALQAN
jgi:hypothetical protein